MTIEINPQYSETSEEMTKTVEGRLYVRIADLNAEIAALSVAINERKEILKELERIQKTKSK